MGKATNFFHFERRATPQDFGNAYNRIMTVKKQRGLASANAQRAYAKALAREVDKFKTNKPRGL